MELDLDLVASFRVLAQEGHYGRAAARLHLTSPALTKRIQRLERQLGVAVLRRGPAGVLQLTTAGQRLANASGALLSHASAVRAVATRQPGRYLVRIGVPAGTGHFLNGIDLAGIVQSVHRSCPEGLFVVREVPFSGLTACLPSGFVDVLWNSASVSSPQVESVPLSVSSPIIGAVSALHGLADAGSVEAGAFCEEAFLYNPALPKEWMDPFWLAGLRPRRDARLVEFTTDDNVAVLRRTAVGDVVTAVPAFLRSQLGPQLRAVELVGAPRLRIYAARRRNDHRDGVTALVQAFQGLAPDEFELHGLSSRGS